MDLGKILGDLIVAGQAALTAGMQAVTIACSADGVDFTLTLTPPGQAVQAVQGQPTGAHTPHLQRTAQPGTTASQRAVR